MSKSCGQGKTLVNVMVLSFKASCPNLKFALFLILIEREKSNRNCPVKFRKLTFELMNEKGKETYLVMAKSWFLRSHCSEKKTIRKTSL